VPKPAASLSRPSLVNSLPDSGSPQPTRPARLYERVAQEIYALKEQSNEMQARLQDLQGLFAELGQAHFSAIVVTRETMLQVSAPDAAETDAQTVRLYCLGTFGVEFIGQPIPLPRSGKAQQLLKYLLLWRGPVARDRLLEALWPESDPDAANNRLKVVLHHLRQAFVQAGMVAGDGGIIVFRNGNYSLNPGLNVWSDLDAFETSVREAKLHERAGQQNRAVQCWLQAEQLYRGDLFESDLFEDWMLARREALKDTYLLALDRLCAFWVQQGEFERALDGWKSILTKDPCREDTYRSVMSAYARLGQRAAALHWYEVCAQTLREQLDVAPEPATLALAEAIRKGAEPPRESVEHISKMDWLKSRAAN